MFIAFFILWLILNSKVTIEIIILGVIISATLNIFISKVLGLNTIKSKTLIKNSLYGISYFFILVMEVVKANVHIIKLVLMPQVELEPQLVHFSVDLKYNWSRVLLANSITLTPGTLVVSLEDNRYSVHVMDKNMAEGIDQSIFVKLLVEMEKVNSKSQYHIEEEMEA